MKIITLGTSHGGAEPNRSCSGTLIEINGSRYLFDCGGSVESKMVNLGLPIESIRCVFISHMHEDHVGSLSAIAKRFTSYVKTDECVKMFFPEKDGITAFKSWLRSMHFSENRLSERVSFDVTFEGQVYRDENICVSAIPTQHLENGRFPSYAFVIQSDNRKILYTGDLACDFHDYPGIVFEENFDAIVCELVHFNIESNFETISKSKTGKLIFTHMRSDRVAVIKDNESKFPFSVYISEDNMEFTI